MSWERKVSVTFWATLAAALPAILLVAYGTLECGELDEGCATGGPMPNAVLAWLLLAGLLTCYGFFMRWVWTAREPD